MIYNKKIEVFFNKETALLLDGQSKKCNWLYNQLVAKTREDYQNGNKLKLTSGRNLRNYATSMKEEYQFLKTVHSSPLKNTAIRLKTAYDKFFDHETGYPKFRSWKEKWFSLYYDEPNKGFKLEGDNSLRLTLGKTQIEDKKGNLKNKQLYAYGNLREKLVLNNDARIKTFRLCKEKTKFYAIFTVEESDKEVSKPKNVRWISIDQNHKNFFVAIDSEGRTFEFMNFYQTKYFDKLIDELKSKRDKCLRKAKKHETEHGNSYYTPSKRYAKLNKSLDKAYSRRQEQIKSNMYQIAHFLCANYDEIIIGNYVPSKATAKFDNMHRSMLNQSHIGAFRKVLSWVATKSSRLCHVVDEKNTTKECSQCGNMEKKAPDVREFTCPVCKTFMLRDVNSAINIGKKAGLELRNKQNLGEITKLGFIRGRINNKSVYRLMVV